MVCWYILTRRYNHFVVLNLSKEELIKLLRNENEIEVDVYFHGIQPYVFNKMIKMISESKDDSQMLLDRIKFEASAEEKYKK